MKRRCQYVDFRGVGDVHAHEVDRWTNAVGGKMMFRQPHRVVAGFVHDLYTLKRPLVHLAEWYASLWPAKKLEYCEFHLRLVTITYPLDSGHRRSSSWRMGVHVNGRCRLYSLVPQPSRSRLSGRFPYHRFRARLRLRVFVRRCRALFGAGVLVPHRFVEDS